jgi:hypothetical protein
MILRLLDFTRVCDAVEALGGTVPASITAVTGSLRSLQRATGGGTVGSPAEVMMSAVKQAAQIGGPLSQEGAHKLLVKIATERLVGEQLAEYFPALEHPTCRLLVELFQGDAGDELITSLRPMADEAITGIKTARGFYNADTTAATVIDLGDEAARAWREAGAHEVTLDRLFGEVLMPMTHLGLIPPEVRVDIGDLLHAAWIIDPAKARELSQVGRHLLTSKLQYNVPGGRWLTIVNIGGLHLNTPRQAIAILKGVKDAGAAADAERYSIQKQREDAQRRAGRKITVRT